MSRSFAQVVEQSNVNKDTPFQNKLDARCCVCKKPCLKSPATLFFQFECRPSPCGEYKLWDENQGFMARPQREPQLDFCARHQNFCLICGYGDADVVENAFNFSHNMLPVCRDHAYSCIYCPQQGSFGLCPTHKGQNECGNKQCVGRRVGGVLRPRCEPPHKYCRECFEYLKQFNHRCAQCDYKWFHMTANQCPKCLKGSGSGSVSTSSSSTSIGSGGS